MGEGDPGSKRERWLKEITAPTASVVAAVFALVGALGGAALKGAYDQRTAINLEREQLQADLILRAIETDDQAQAVKTLRFFANSGLIPSYEAKVLTLAEENGGEAIPTLRSTPDFEPISGLTGSSGIDPILALELGRSVVGLELKGGLACTGVLLRGMGVLVPSFCVRGQGDDFRAAEQFRLRFDFDGRADSDAGFSIGVATLADIGGHLAILQPENDPRVAGRGLEARARALHPSETLFMIHHPNGQSKQVSPGCYALPEPLVPTPDELRGFVGDKILAFACRTKAGSAGAPMFATADSALLGIHVGTLLDGSQAGIELSEALADAAQAATTR